MVVALKFVFDMSLEFVELVDLKGRDDVVSVCVFLSIDLQSFDGFVQEVYALVLDPILGSGAFWRAFDLRGSAGHWDLVFDLIKL